MKNCENCDLEHDGSFASGRFCSKKCASGFSTKAKRADINARLTKLAESKRKEPEFVICQNCEISFKKRRSNSKFCSIRCKCVFISNLPENVERVSKLMRKSAHTRYENGDTTIGWQHRNKFSQSKPEKEAEQILLEYGHKFEKEFRVGKYFLDFAFIEEKIDLEIDGRQHDDHKVIVKDEKRDKFLANLGWKIVRVKWNQIATVAQMVECVLGKNEVAGSIPASGSREAPRKRSA